MSFPYTPYECGSAARIAQGALITKFLKLTNHPFVLPSVTAVQTLDQPVLMVEICPAGTVPCLVVWQIEIAHALTLLTLPFYISTLTRLKIIIYLKLSLFSLLESQ